MSNVLEKTLSSLVGSVFGSSTSNQSSLIYPQGTTGLKNVSLGLVHFVQKLQAAQNISKQEEQYCLERESIEWIKLLSSPGVASGVISDVMCRALIASVRGYVHPSLHIHAIKLTQNSNSYHKRIGYLFVCQCLEWGSELTLLLVNTIQRDLCDPNALHIAAALTSLPSVLTSDITHTVATRITPCLAHQQVYIRRKAASVVGVIGSNGDSDLNATYIPHLLHLLTDQDPGVALNATSTLANIHKSNMESESELRDQIAKSACNLLTQALNGSLPKDYQVNAIPAPFQQIQMLRVIQDLSEPTWQVPTQVTTVLNEVIQQPWGTKDIILYAVLYECIVTITKLPYNTTTNTTTTTTTTTLIEQGLKVVLGFLKSSNVDLKFMGIKGTSLIISAISDDLITPAHLEGIIDCLYHSSNILQSSTLTLLCAMANVHNYKAVCTTLLEFCNRNKDECKQDMIISELSDILTRDYIDVVWAVDFITPLILATKYPDARFVSALKHLLQRGLAKANTNSKTCEILTDILCKISKPDQNCAQYINLISHIINLSPKNIPQNILDNFLTSLKKLVDLSKLDVKVFDTLQHIALNYPPFSEEIIGLLEPYTGGCDCPDLVIYAQDSVRWLRNRELSLRVIQRMDTILNDKNCVDLSLSFLDNYVVNSMENNSVYQSHPPKCTPSMVYEGGRTSSEDGDGFDTTLSSSGIQSSSGSFSRSVAPAKNVWSICGRQNSKTETQNLPKTADDGADDDGGSVEMGEEVEEEDDEEVEEQKEKEGGMERDFLSSVLMAGLGRRK